MWTLQYVNLHADVGFKFEPEYQQWLLASKSQTAKKKVFDRSLKKKMRVTWSYDIKQILYHCLLYEIFFLFTLNNTAFWGTFPLSYFCT